MQHVGLPLARATWKSVARKLSLTVLELGSALNSGRPAGTAEPLVSQMNGSDEVSGRDRAAATSKEVDFVEPLLTRSKREEHTTAWDFLGMAALRTTSDTCTDHPRHQAPTFTF